MKYRGMSGCLRQAAVDAGVEKKFNLGPGNSMLYNDKQGDGSRRFNWQNGQKTRMTKPETKKYLAALDKLLEQHNLKVSKSDLNHDRNPMIWCKINEDGQIAALKEKAASYGYRLVKMRKS